MSIFWSYNGLVADSTSGGVGSSSCHSFVQGSYDYCLPGVGCLYHDYPWLDMTAHADGRGTGSGGG